MSGSPSLATRRNNSATAEVLVPLREDGDKPPLFHTTAGYRDMRLFGRAAEGLGEGRPVYGLQPPGESVVKGVREKSLDWLVSEYIKQIKSVQNNGPYYLSGYSGGGLLAAETAKTLIKAGDPVAFLAVMDPPLRVPPWLTLCYLSLFKLCNLTPTADRIRWWIIRRSGNRLLRWVSDKGMGTHMALLRGVEVRSYPGRLIYIEPERPWVRALNLLARMRTSWLNPGSRSRGTGRRSIGLPAPIIRCCCPDTWNVSAPSFEIASCAATPPIRQPIPGFLATLPEQPVDKVTRRSAGDASRLKRAASRPSSLRFGRNTLGIPPSRALSAGRLARLDTHATLSTGC